jgi:hypothetical protein
MKDEMRERRGYAEMRMEKEKEERREEKRREEKRREERKKREEGEGGKEGQERRRKDVCVKI